MEIREEEILDAIRSLSPGDLDNDDSWTTDEICIQLNKSDKWVRPRLKKLIEQGVLDPVMSLRRRMDGDHARRRAYRVRSK